MLPRRNWNRWTVKKMSKLGLESDGPEELWMTECVCIANRHEHAGEVDTFFSSRDVGKAHWVLDEVQPTSSAIPGG